MILRNYHLCCRVQESNWDYIKKKKKKHLLELCIGVVMGDMMDVPEFGFKILWKGVVRKK